MARLIEQTHEKLLDGDEPKKFTEVRFDGTSNEVMAAQILTFLNNFTNYVERQVMVGNLKVTQGENVGHNTNIAFTEKIATGSDLMPHISAFLTIRFEDPQAFNREGDA